MKNVYEKFLFSIIVLDFFMFWYTAENFNKFTILGLIGANVLFTLGILTMARGKLRKKR